MRQAKIGKLDQDLYVLLWRHVRWSNQRQIGIQVMPSRRDKYVLRFHVSMKVTRSMDVM